MNTVISATLWQRELKLEVLVVQSEKCDVLWCSKTKPAPFHTFLLIKICHRIDTKGGHF